MPEFIERSKIFSIWRSMPAPASVTSLSAAIHQTPAADVVPVVPELQKAVKILSNEYEKARQNPIVRDPLAYALYRTWKAVDGKNGR